MCKHRAEEIAFVYQNNKTNESITLASKLYVFGKSMEKVTYLWKIKLVVEPSTMIHANSVSFLISTDDRIQKYSSMFGFPWTNPSVNFQWYIKNVCSGVAYGL